MLVNILVVDDSKIMRNSIKAVLSKMKIACNFIEATDGKQALAELGTQSVDLVLLDWTMPKLSGLEFLKEVRSQEKHKTLPIIMVTSKTARGDVMDAIQNGATDYVTKPINVNLFMEKLSRLPLFKNHAESGGR